MKVNGEPIDVTGPKLVQVVVRDDRKVLWVNVEGICLFRACQIGTVMVEYPLAVVDLNSELIVGAEFGFRCHEKGMNLQAMLEKLKEVIKNGSIDRKGKGRT